METKTEKSTDKPISRMMQKIVLFLLLSSFFISHADSQPIRFEPISWQEALGKARKEHKMLFVEIYTTWCTYCRQMEQNVFSTKEAGAFYNQHFINVRYDAQKSDGIQILKSYAMLGFPTFLYLDPNGLVVKKTAGYQNIETFTSMGDSALLYLETSKSQPVQK